MRTAAGRPVARGLVVVAVVTAALTGCSGGTSEAPSSTASPATTPASTAQVVTPSTPTGSATSTATAPSGPVSNSATSTRTAASEASLADGRYPANLEGVDASRRTVTIDVVQFFTGDAAAKAAKEDGGESPPPNDYWIRNANPRTRTFTVTTGAKITVNTLAVEETGSATQNVSKTLAQLAAYRDFSYRLFWVTVSGGKVTALQEQFLP